MTSSALGRGERWEAQAGHCATGQKHVAEISRGNFTSTVANKSKDTDVTVPSCAESGMEMLQSQGEEMGWLLLTLLSLACNANGPVHTLKMLIRN